MDNKTIDVARLEKELYKRIDEIIHYIWDPIGVSGVPQARDEYYSYLAEIQSLVLSGCEKSEIANHLTMIEVDRMGMKSTTERNLEVADMLIDWYDFLKKLCAW